MTHGRNICKQLKEVRKRIAEENDIPLKIEECTFKGECRGTCPRCEAEVRYLENALADRKILGKAVRVAGVALALVAGGKASAQVQQSTPIPVHDITDTAKSEENDDVIFGMLDPEPEYPGGIEALYNFMRENIRYPQEAKKLGIEGRVFVNFVIDTDGTVSEPRILRDIGGGCGEEVLRVVNMMPRWKPALHRGKPLRTRYNLPVSFTLPEEEKNKQP